MIEPAAAAPGRSRRCARLLALACLALAPAAALAEAREPEVRLVEAGSEPRYRLRLGPEPGISQTLRMRLQMGMRMTANGEEGPPQQTPPWEMDMESTVRSIAPNGDVDYTFRVLSVGLGDDPATPPEVREQIQSGLQGLVGLGGTGTLTARGYSKETRLEIPATLPPQQSQTLQGLHQSMKQMSVPLPEEPVGLGGAWEVTSTLEQNGLQVGQRIRYEVTSIDEERVRARVTGEQRADNQPLPPTGQPGTSAELLSLKTELEGETVLQHAGFLPESSRLEGRSVTEVRVTTPEGTTLLATESTMVSSSQLEP